MLDSGKTSNNELFLHPGRVAKRQVVTAKPAFKAGMAVSHSDDPMHDEAVVKNIDCHVSYANSTDGRYLQTSPGCTCGSILVPETRQEFRRRLATRSDSATACPSLLVPDQSILDFPPGLKSSLFDMIEDRCITAFETTDAAAVEIGAGNVLCAV